MIQYWILLLMTLNTTMNGARTSCRDQMLDKPTRIDFRYLREHLLFTHARLREATQAGDWPQAQRLLEELEEILRRLEMIIRGS